MNDGDESVTDSGLVLACVGYCRET